MESVTLVALFIAVVALGSEWLANRSITLPIIVAIGGLIMSDDGLGWLSLAPDVELVLEVTEVTLALLLFADASTLSLRNVLRGAGPETRLLGIGLPLTIALGGLFAYILFPDEPLGLVLLIGAALAPTDAALGLPIFTNRDIPQEIRDPLNVESGLNDGLVTPFVSLFTVLTISELPGHEGGWLREALREISVGLLIGLIAGIAGGYLIRTALDRQWASEEMGQISLFALSIGTFFGARELDGNGFIAAFVGGLACGAVMRNRAHTASGFTETAGTGLSLIVWIVFGAGLVPLILDEAFSWNAVLYALLSLTVVRMIPVAISLAGAEFPRRAVALMGWFGPRGLASIVFLTSSLVSLEAAGEESRALVGAMGWTIGLSVLLHGVTAGPLGRWYAERAVSNLSAGRSTQSEC